MALLCWPALAGAEGQLGEWTSTRPMLDYSANPTTVLLASGDALEVGGNEAELYDPSTNAWTPAAPAGTGPTNGIYKAVRLADGRVLAIGGSELTAVHSVAEAYDPTGNSWSRVAQMAVARDEETTTLLSSGRVLVAGGTTGYALHYSGLSSAEIYDPESDTWTPTAPMGTPRSGAAAVPLGNGDVLVVGGVEEPNSGSDVLASAEIYDADTDSWRAVAPMATAREWTTATLLPGEQVLVTGGVTSWPPLSSAETYSVSRDAWTAVGPMATGRALHTATVLQDGKVLVAGGCCEGPSAGKSLSSVEVFDPNTDTFTAIAPMHQPRELHAATLLGNGQVLVVGGDAGRGGGLNSAELFTPPSPPAPAGGTMQTPAVLTSNLSHVSVEPSTILLRADAKLRAGGKKLAFVRYTARDTGSSAFLLQRRVRTACPGRGRRRQVCTRYVGVGGFSHSVIAGRHQFALSRDMLGRAARTGSCRFKIFTVSSEGAGAITYASFRVIAQDARRRRHQ